MVVRVLCIFSRVSFECLKRQQWKGLPVIAPIRNQQLSLSLGPRIAARLDPRWDQTDKRKAGQFNRSDHYKPRPTAVLGHSRYICHLTG
jgi:hypothetical protein